MTVSLYHTSNKKRVSIRKKRIETLKWALLNSNQ